MAIYATLMKHQLVVLDFMLKSKSTYHGIFAAYGTGKTVIALAYMNLASFKKVLVISSKTAVMSTWVDEIQQWSDFNYTFLLGTQSQRLVNFKLGIRKINSQVKKKPFIFLLNFDGVHSIFNELCDIKFDLIVIDESTRIKSIDTDRTKAIIKLGSYAKHRIIMTGFPVTENLTNIYSQIKFLDQGKSLGNSFYSFRDKYFVKMGMGIYPKKKGAEEILRLIKPFCIRITGKDLKLPPSIYKVIHVEPNEQQKKLLKSLYELMRVEFGKIKIDTVYIFTLISKALQICSGFLKESDEYDNDGNLIKKGTHIESFQTAKDEALFDLLDEIDLDQNKVIIWCIFRHSISKLEKLFKKIGYPALALTGDTKDVNTVVHKFQHDKKSRVILAIQKKASESITLTICNHAVYYENGWSNDLRMNSEARIRRKGSEHHNSIFYTDLCIKGSIEEKIIKCLHDKANMVSNLQEAFLKEYK